MAKFCEKAIDDRRVKRRNGGQRTVMRRAATVFGLLLRPRRRQNVPARAARYLGLAAWFGGSVARALAVEPASRSIADPQERAELLHATAAQWRLVALPAIAAHVAGSAVLGWAGRHRGVYQQGMPTAMVLDTGATLAGLAAGLAGGDMRRLGEPLLACGSLLAQGYLAEQQRPTPTLRRLRGAPTGRGLMRRSSPARAVHDMGLAATFGGALMARVGLAGATSPLQRRAACMARTRWWPIAVTAAAAHLLGQRRLAHSNRLRLAVQDSAGTAVALEAGVGGGALVAAVVAARLARRCALGYDEQGVEPARLRAAEWAVVVLAAAGLVLDAVAAEQQRPQNVAIAAGAV